VLEGQDVQAARLFGAIEATQAELSRVQSSPFERRTRERFERILRERLGPERLEREWAIGRAMTPAQILAFAFPEQARAIRR